VGLGQTCCQDQVLENFLRVAMGEAKKDEVKSDFTIGFSQCGSSALKAGGSVFCCSPGQNVDNS
jgi:hypothetical protein